MRFDFYTPNEVGNILSQRLKYHRVNQDLTQKELAEQAGVGLSTVARIETGQGGTFDNVIRIAVALGLINDFATLFDTTPKTIDEVMKKPKVRPFKHRKTKHSQN